MKLSRLNTFYDFFQVLRIFGKKLVPSMLDNLYHWMQNILPKKLLHDKKFRSFIEASCAMHIENTD